MRTPLKSLFQELEVLQPVERERRLEAMRHTEPEIHAQLCRLFADDTRVAGREDVLDQLAQAAGNLAGRPAPRPDRIDRYRIVRVLGEGGMGRVYEAEQIEPVQRRVALKLTRSALDPADVLARFQAERQALAVLDHAHIARVFDAGSTPDGCPWFAMELVDGMSITRWAQQRGLSLRERVQLFLPVLDAVQHAHRKGLIHRDLKPSNLLVVDAGGLGLPKVIDFGIAKVVQGGGQEAGDCSTQVGQLLGTPEYMSPEQASLGQIDVDTRSDVYSLGLVLYELCTGTLPPTLSGLRRHSFAEMCRQIRDVEAPRASSVVAQDVDGLPIPGSGQRSDWLHSLRTELDHVLAKALAKDRELRYGSVADLGDDLRRFLDDRPVLATAPSLRYRAGKFLRRHRMPVLSVTLILIALVAGSIIAGVGLIEARQAAAVAERERHSAQAATGFLVELFQAADPRNNPGLDLTARELLARGLERLERLESQPQVQAELLGTLGDVYWMLGSPDEAEPLLRRALALWQTLDTGSRMNEVRVLNRLAGLLRDRNQFAEGQALFRRALAILADEGGLGSPDEVTLLNNLGILLVRTEQFDEAEQVFARGIELMEQHTEADPDAHRSWRSSLANLLGNLAHLQVSRGDFVAASASAERSLAIIREQLPPEHPNLAIQHSNLAFLLAGQGELGRALVHARRSVAINEVALTPEHPTAAAHFLNLARVEARLGFQVDAIDHLQRSIAGYRASLGDASYELTRPLSVLAVVRYAQGDPGEALRISEQVIDQIRSSDYPSATRDLAAALRRHVIFLRAQAENDPAQALRLAREALALVEQQQRADDQALAHLLLAVVETDEQRAQDHWRQGHDLARCGSNASCVLDKADELVLAAHWWLRAGNLDEAVSAVRRAIEHPGWSVWMLDTNEVAALTDDPRWPELQSLLAQRRYSALEDGMPASASVLD